MTMEGNVPRTEEQLSRVLAERPRGWEYLVFAGALVLELEPLESRYEDYRLGYAPRLGSYIFKSEFFEYLQAQLNEVKALAENLDRLFNDEVTEAAFGPPGVEGNLPRLLHLAKRVISVYDEFLRWVERLRGTSVPDNYSHLIAILARYADQPIEEIRRFVGEYAESIERVPDAIASGTPLRLEHRLTFYIPAEVSKAYHKELKRVKSRSLVC